jgi:hypothetical protein
MDRLDRVCHGNLDALARWPVKVPDLDGMAAAEALDHRAIIEQAGDPGGVECRRHHQDAQILTQARLDVERQRQAEISLERAFMKLVEDHAIDALEIRR